MNAVIPGVALDQHSKVPPYEQLKAQITLLVDGRELAVGTRLPPVRALAQELGLAPNTVARVYRELEAAGVLDTRGRAGTFVAATDNERAAREAAVAYVSEVRSLGVGLEDALANVSRLWG